MSDEDFRRLLQPFARPTLLSGGERPGDVLLTPLTAAQVRLIQEALGVNYTYRQPPLEEWLGQVCE